MPVLKSSDACGGLRQLAGTAAQRQFLQVREPHQRTGSTLRYLRARRTSLLQRKA
ncbi:MAG: hypothetical protein V7L29_16410 [Nostoc sp.]|uniref:hypothetical protein n=1 Tax=Nostoc sp. TaxID=1180 RepID=UPI002FF0F1CA